MAERTLFADLKHQYRFGGMTTKLLFINTIVFLAIQVVLVFSRLIATDGSSPLVDVVQLIFSLDTAFPNFFFKPWGLFTSIFTHYSLMHFFLNMLFLYFSGKMFETLFDEKRLLYTYLLGGIAGGIFEIVAHLVFPALQKESIVVVGASGSIMAIFTALALYRPNLKVHLFGILPVRIIILAGFFILSDFVSLGTLDGTAHFAHLGGAIIGGLSIRSLYSSNNIINRTQAIGDRILRFLASLSDKRPKMKVKKGGNADGNRQKTDEEYALEKTLRQRKTDAILDKISTSGYDSLTKAEKDFLFNQSKNG